MTNIGETSMKLRHGRGMPRKALTHPLCPGQKSISGRESGIDLLPDTLWARSLRQAVMKAERRDRHDQPW